MLYKKQLTKSYIVFTVAIGLICVFMAYSELLPRNFNTVLISQTIN